MWDINVLNKLNDERIKHTYSSSSAIYGIKLIKNMNFIISRNYNPVEKQTHTLDV